MEGALGAGDDALVLKLLEKLSDEEHLMLLKDMYQRQISADGSLSSLLLCEALIFVHARRLTPPASPGIRCRVSGRDVAWRLRNSHGVRPSFFKMDKDHDGKITQEEFIDYIKEVNDNQFRKPTG